MDSLAIHLGSDSCFCGEDSDFFVSSAYYCFGSRDGHAEDMTTDIYFLLEPAESIDTRSIAGEYDDISSSIPELLDSSGCQSTDLLL
jgi:hypothetical protein